MGILKDADDAIENMGKKYKKAEKDTRNIRKTGGAIFDFIIPPPKKGGKATKVKVSKCPPCSGSKKRKR